MRRFLINVWSAAAITATLLTIGSVQPQEINASIVARLFAERSKARSEKLVLSLRLEKPVVRSGEPISLRFTLKNSNKHSVFVHESHPDIAYRLLLKNEKGLKVPLTEYGEWLQRTTQDTRLVTIEVKPGEEKQDDVVLNKIFEMTAPGQYTVTTTRQVFFPNGKYTIVSRAITVRVNN